MFILNGWFEFDKEMNFFFWFKWNLNMYDKMVLEIVNFWIN